VLEKHKLGHRVVYRGKEIVYQVYCLDSEFMLESALELPIDNMMGSNVWQEFGKATTYLRRYLAQAFWNLIPEDTDAQGAPKTEAPARKTSETQAKQSKAEATVAEDIL
jgi:hypothetical protein